MLGNRYSAEISRNAQEQVKEAGIQKISAMGVTKFAAGQLAERGREIAPEIGISDWSEGKREPLPGRPDKDKRQNAPVAKSPEQTRAATLSGPGVNRLRDHFQERSTFEVTDEMKKSAPVVSNSLTGSKPKFTNAAYFTATSRKGYGSSLAF